MVLHWVKPFHSFRPQLRPGSCLCLLLIVSIFVLVPLGSGAQRKEFPTLEAFSGVYIQELPTNSIFYTTVAPLVYGFKVPNWSQNETLLPSINCTVPFLRLDKFCPIISNLSKIQSRFSEYLFNNRPLLHRFLSMGATPQVTDIQFECHKLGRHFQDIYVDQGVMQRYLEKLKGCSPAGDLEYFRHLTNYDYNISLPYRETFKNFHDYIWDKVHEPEIYLGLFSNARGVFNSFNFLNYHIELNRWHLALGDCEAGRIPSSLLTPELITDSLQELFETLDRSNLQPVISASNVGNYFKNSLADCTFTNESLIVRILVPVIAKEHSYSLYSIRPATFYDGEKDRYCQIVLTKDIFLLDNLERVAYDTICTGEEFCHVPSSKSSGSKIDPCASALLNDDWEDALEYCPFSCYSLSKYHKRNLGEKWPLSVMQMDATTFLLAGINMSGSGISVTCQGPGHDSTVQIKGERISAEMGALEVGLPCGCILTVGNKKFTPTKPCFKEGPNFPKFRQVVPFNWVREPEKVFSTLRLLGDPTKLSYVEITREDLIMGDETRKPSRGRDGMELFLILSCVLITLGLCIFVGMIARKLTSLGINLFSYGGVTDFKIPGTVTYQNMQQDQDL